MKRKGEATTPPAVEKPIQEDPKNTQPRIEVKQNSGGASPGAPIFSKTIWL
jgi:hypothetical protein